MENLKEIANACADEKSKGTVPLSHSHHLHLSSQPLKIINWLLATILH
jgi:hypothetical protein